MSGGRRGDGPGTAMARTSRFPAPQPGYRPVVDLDGIWRVERTGGLLPPLRGVRKRIHGARGATLLGGSVGFRFDVAGRELRYRAPLGGLVDVLDGGGDVLSGRATFLGRELGRFRMTRARSTTTGLEEQLVNHIDEAYAMEQNVLRILDGMISTTDDPEIVRELQHHRMQTEGHAERMQARLEAHDASPSTIREAGGVLGALMKLPLDMVRSEQAGRNARDGYATEHMEIASYELLARIAERAGDETTATVAREMIEEEREMARTIEANWDTFAQLSLREAGVTV
jgi:ferritin-like metal-binding protein YciE